MKENEKWAKVSHAVDSHDPKETAALVVEVLLDDSEDTAEIAADFIENEVGRFDWVNNWRVIRSAGDPTPKVQSYLDTYGLVANPVEIVAAIDRMAAENPGRWK